MNPAIPSCDDRPIWDLWLSSLWHPTVTVASELDVFEVLAGGALTAPAVAERLGLAPRGSETLLRMLVALDLLALHSGQYQLTALAREFLLRASPYYWGHVWQTLDRASPIHTRIREALLRKTASGATGPGQPPPVVAWETGQIDMEMAGRIARFMHSHSMAAAAGLARNCNFDGVSRLLDVGGGSGCFSIALAGRHPRMRCTIMELPAMCRLATEYIAAANIGERVDTVGVDMFHEAWPKGYDALFFSNVFHDWTFETCAELAAHARDALPAGGRIVLHEMLLDDAGTGPRTAAAFSMLMLAGTRGQQFTFAELQALLEAAGFADVDVQPSYGYYSLVSGRKP